MVEASYRSEDDTDNVPTMPFRVVVKLGIDRLLAEDFVLFLQLLCLD